MPTSPRSDVAQFGVTLAFFVDKGQESNHTSTLDGCVDIALLASSQASDPTGQDFTALGDEFTEEFYILVVNGLTGGDGG